MKSITVFKLLVGLTIVSVGCVSFASNNGPTHEAGSNQFKYFTKISPTSCSSKKEPAQVIKNDPVIATLQLIKSLSFSQCRIVSSDHNGWVVDYKIDGHFSPPYFTFIKNFDLLNRQTAIVLDDRFVALCPIRIRPSNSPPII